MKNKILNKSETFWLLQNLYYFNFKSQKKGFSGPHLGPKMSDENKREFTDEQLRAGDSTIGLQAGYNKGASQR
jgi:hypothetical protein